MFNNRIALRYIYVLLVAISVQIFPGQSLGIENRKEYVAPSSHYSGNVQGSFSANAYENRPNDATITGRATFVYQFKQPVRPKLAAGLCDKSYWGSACDRKCHYMESLVIGKGAIEGYLVIRRRDSCQSPISGEIERPTAVFAHNSCHRQKAWGRTLTIDIEANAGPLYAFRNPRSSIEGNKRKYSDNPEFIWPYVRISAPLTIQCFASTRKDEVGGQAAPQRPTCDPGYSYDPDQKKCVSNCGSGQNWDTKSKRCVASKPGLVCVNGKVRGKICWCGIGKFPQQVGANRYECKK